MPGVHVLRAIIIMKISSIITIVFGIILIILSIGVYASLPSAKDDADVTFYLLMMAFAGFGGICLIIAGIIDLIKCYKNEKDN